MGLPLLLFGAGAAFNMLGKFQADAAQQKAEADNASFYREQANFEIDAMEREVSIFERKSTQMQGEQITAIAASGTALSASNLQILASERSLMSNEKQAIIQNGRFKARLASMRGVQAQETADYLGSSERRLTTVAGGFLTAASAAYSK